MRDIEIEFWGLCALIARKPDSPAFEVYLPTGNSLPDPACDQKDKVAHVATMAIPVERVNTRKGEITWHPTSVIHFGGKQIACWQLNGSVAFDTPLSKLPEWKDRKEGMVFTDHHPHNPARPDDEIDSDYPRFVLSGGEIDCGEGRKVEIKKASVKHQERELAQRVRWRPGVSTLKIRNKNGQYVSVRAGDYITDTTITITNVSTLPPESQNHFGFYYTLLSGTVACDDRLTLHPPEHHHTALSKRAEETYDCVPPGSGS